MLQVYVQIKIRWKCQQFFNEIGCKRFVNLQALGIHQTGLWKLADNLTDMQQFVCLANPWRLRIEKGTFYWLVRLLLLLVCLQSNLELISVTTHVLLCSDCSILRSKLHFRLTNYINTLSVPSQYVSSSDYMNEYRLYMNHLRKIFGQWISQKKKNEDVVY